jgi:hypothetical protein
VTTTLSPPVRIFAVLGVLAAVGFAAFTFLMGGGEVSLESSEPLVPPTKRTSPAPTPATRAPAPKPARTQRPAARAATSGFPVPVERALRKSRLVVVVVSTPRASVDAVVRAEARAAARSTNAGYVSLSALHERQVRTLVAKTGVLPSPAVLVVRRSGEVAARFGVTDHVTIAQAVAQARR